jgi:hypothetical protein
MYCCNVLEMMEQSSHHITDLDPSDTTQTGGNEEQSSLARSLGNNALPNLKRLSLFYAIVAMMGS